MSKSLLRIPLTGPGTEDPKLAAKPAASTLSGIPNINLVEARDIIANHIAKGGTGLQDAESRGDFNRLSAMLGPEKAQKLFTKLALYNQDSGVRNLPYGEKVAKFYEFGHGNDKDIFDVFQRIKQIGQGVKAGTNDSQYRGVQDAANANNNRIMLKIAKK